MPSSLSTELTLTKIVSFLIDFFSSSTSIIPSFCMGITVISNPSSCISVHEDTIELCSIELIIMCLPTFLYLSQIPLIAKLLDSLAPEVYIISSFRHFNFCAIFEVYNSIKFLSSTPSL